MILPRIETVLLNYLAANFQAAADPLYGLTCLAGHRAAQIDQSQTGTPYLVITAVSLESPLLDDAGVYSVQAQIKLLGPATPAGQTALNARSREIENIFAAGRMESVLAWINTTQTAVNVACNALRLSGASQDGRVPEREQLGVVHLLEGDWYVEADETLSVS